MKDKIKEIITVIKPGLDINEDTELVESGILTSLEIVRLVGNLQDEFDVEISVLDLVPENFNSINSIEQLIAKLQEEG